MNDVRGTAIDSAHVLVDPSDPWELPVSTPMGGMSYSLLFFLTPSKTRFRSLSSSLQRFIFSERPPNPHLFFFFHSKSIGHWSGMVGIGEQDLSTADGRKNPNKNILIAEVATREVCFSNHPIVSRIVGSNSSRLRAPGQTRVYVPKTQTRALQDAVLAIENDRHLTSGRKRRVVK